MNYPMLWFYLDAFLGKNIRELNANLSHFHTVREISIIKSLMERMEVALADRPFEVLKYAALWTCLTTTLNLYIRINQGRLENQSLIPIALIKWFMGTMEADEAPGGA